MSYLSSLLSDGKMLTNCYSYEYTDADVKENILEEGFTVRKAVFSQSDNLLQPSSPGDSPLLTPATSACLTPLSSSHPLTLGLLHGGMMGGGASLPTCSSAIPCNISFAGDFGFKVMDFELVEDRFKNSNIIYSLQKQRAYIKMGMSVPFNFTFTGALPPDAILRAMCIHSAPEHIADNLVCCPKHHDLNQKKGLLQPAYFIRPAYNDSASSFCREENSRLSILTPLKSLRKMNCEYYTSLYCFPCHTSDFSKASQSVQVVFTLECKAKVLGRATVDIRVCSSPGRDHAVDHGKKRKGLSKKDSESASPSHVHKRRNPAQVEVTKCTLPPKKVCQGLSRKKVCYTIEMYPEVIPYIDVFVSMIEKVQSVPVMVAAPTLQRQSARNEPCFDTLESWLEHLGLLRYRKHLQKYGISDTAQVLEVTDKELKHWGMRTQAHRKKFLDGKSLICPLEANEESNSPLLFSQSSATAGSSGTQPLSQSKAMSQSFEVLEFTHTVKRSLTNNPS